MAASDSSASGWPADGDFGDSGGSYTIPEIRLPFWTQIIGRSGAKAQEKVKDMANMHAQRVGRPPTQDEVNAFSDIIRNSEEVQATGLLVNVALALASVRRTRKTFGFPFWQPKFVSTSPDVFPTIARPVLSGLPARATWHALRFTAYGMTWFAAVSVVVTSIVGGQTVTTFRTDPRLRDALHQLEGRGKVETEMRRKLFRLRQLPSNTPRDVLEKELGAIQTALSQIERDAQDPSSELGSTNAVVRQSVLREARQSYGEAMAGLQRKISADQDRRGDQAFAQQKDIESLSGSNSPITAPASEWPTQPSGYTQSSPAQGSQQSGWNTTPSTASTGSDSFDADDDASPVARHAQNSSSTGSAWDRVRQQALAGKQARTQPPAPTSATATPPPSSWESGTTSSSGWGSSESKADGSGSSWGSEEKSSGGRSQAQREFDELVQRDRKN